MCNIYAILDLVMCVSILCFAQLHVENKKKNEDSLEEEQNESLNPRKNKKIKKTKTVLNVL